MFSNYKKFRRERAVRRWVVKMERDYNIVHHYDDDGAHVFESNYNRKNRK